MDLLEQYFVAQDGFGAVVAAVPAERWDAPSPCAAWTVRDIVGHVLWGRRRLATWITGEDYPETAGAPGAPRPRVLCAGDPARAWRTACDETAPVLTAEGLARVRTIEGFGTGPLTSLLPVFVTDALVHSWDVAHATGVAVTLDPRLVTDTAARMRAIPLQRPEFFGPEVTPPQDADETTRLLAFLGRRAWVPA
ncbi:TIGR03086 family metal-binding protein [Amycolatopsis rhabdoformis]|uniref:TIGR03086 family metal-binding protein n=1 Tax=Amycolatopsis rhabdoformis TaxID=1448059 RepID=A0ABZ1ICD8_9PSEU|nr:TIGR03086 family metal-binding protein [Amycolatopsis rhabdoformis]WSE31798.1 TIGR03086 family metal-binding protein [Amycolatopsis rhabdoformis]